MRTKKNIPLLLKVKEAILDNYTHFYMHSFLGYQAIEKNSLSACGTTACIAGWACFINNPDLTRFESDRWFSVADEARKALNLSKRQENLLFYTGNWPSKFIKAFDLAEYRGNRTQMAKIAADRIDYFIKYGK